jgi:hypothetical protein
LGTIVLIMGARSDGNPGPSLFGQTRSSLLALLYGHVDERFYLRQMIRAVGGGNGAVQRELKCLADLGLVVRRTQGNQVLYQANTQGPLFSEIKSLITKTVGVHDAIRSALAGLGSEVQLAFVYGSVASLQERADSDVDLMIVGDVQFGEVVSALGPAQRTLGREINPAVFPASEFRSKLSSGNHFLQAVMKGKKVFVVGNEHELTELAAE